MARSLSPLVRACCAEGRPVPPLMAVTAMNVYIEILIVKPRGRPSQNQHTNEPVHGHAVAHDPDGVGSRAEVGRSAVLDHHRVGRDGRV